MTIKNISKKIILIATCTMLAISATQAAGGSRNISGFLGNKSLDKNDWGSFHNQTELGIIFDFKPEGWPIRIALDTVFAADSESGSGNFSNKEKALTVETQIGIRKIFEINDSPFKPYIGGGLSFVSATLERRFGVGLVEDDDSTTGYWIGSGGFWHVTKRLNIGFDIRYSEAEVTLFNADFEAGGLHAGITIGSHW